jgi:hypothetical protein
VREWQARGVEAVYGDVTDAEFLAGLPLTSASWVISTLRHHGPYLNAPDPRQTMLKMLLVENFEGQIAVAVYDPAEKPAVERGGATMVLEPYVLVD